MKIWGIKRDLCFSPGSETRDEAIFAAVCGTLERLGYAVCVKTEAECAENAPCDACAIFSMARSEEALCALAAYERQSVAVINPTVGVRNCSREVWTACFQCNGISIPPSACLNLTESFAETQVPELPDALFPCWVKRGDQCSQTQGDVCFVTEKEEMVRVCQDFRRRGISSAVLSSHVSGDLIKFYGVQGTPFFKYFYPSERGYSKFGWEHVNGPAHRFSFDVQALKQCCDLASRSVQVPVYGGDCIVDARGDFYLIDWNDWPSFSSCVEEAAEAIVICLLSKIKNERAYEQTAESASSKIARYV